jgi:hypothetical protein
MLELEQRESFPLLNTTEIIGNSAAMTDVGKVTNAIVTIPNNLLNKPNNFSLNQ